MPIKGQPVGVRRTRIGLVLLGTTILASLGGACSKEATPRSGIAPPEVVGSVEDATPWGDPVETCFRWLIREEIRIGEASVLYLEGPEASEPDAKLLSRLSVPGIQMKGRSKAPAVPDLDADGSSPAIVDPETRARGAILTVKQPRHQAEDVLEVEVSRTGGMLNGVGHSLTLHRKQAGWFVAVARMRWIS
jgi:hypothetical protein